MRQSTTLSGYTRFFSPVLTALASLGGSARSSQVNDSVVAAMKLSEKELAETLVNGVSRVSNQIDWARFYLAKTGYLDSSKRGVWTLTEKGRSAKLTAENVKAIVRDVNRNLKPTPQATEGSILSPISVDDLSPPENLDHRALLLATVKALSPKGFEELCRYLLLESGFEEVFVTGRAGDGGIDGRGILRVNRLISMNVVFQCKRFSASVGPSMIRDFRGALSTRDEKGIFLTTGRFTQAAESEARRDGAVPIELVDGERLVELFEEMEIGLKNPRKIFELDDGFFEKFR